MNILFVVSDWTLGVHRCECIYTLVNPQCFDANHTYIYGPKPYWHVNDSDLGNFHSPLPLQQTAKLVQNMGSLSSLLWISPQHQHINILTGLLVKTLAFIFSTVKSTQQLWPIYYWHVTKKQTISPSQFSSF